MTIMMNELQKTNTRALRRAKTKTYQNKQIRIAKGFGYDDVETRERENGRLKKQSFLGCDCLMCQNERKETKHNGKRMRRKMNEWELETGYEDCEYE